MAKEEPTIEPSEPVTEPTTKPVTETTEPKESTEKTFTRDELGKMIAAEVAKHDAGIEERINKAKEEAYQQGQDDSKLSAKELADKQAEADRKRFEDERQQFEHDKKLFATKQKLQDVGLPADFAETVMSDDDTATDAKISKLQELINAQVQAGIDERLKGKSTPNTSAPTGGVPTKKLSEMTIDEQSALYRDDPELYKQLSQQG